MQLTKAIEQYLWSRSKKLSSNTLETYERNLRFFARWIGDNRLLKDITDEDVDRFQLHLKTALQYKEKTQSNYANTLKGFFKYWHAKGESGVAWELIEGPRIPEVVPNFITPEGYELIDAFLDQDDYRTLTKRLIMALLWDTGMRISELVALDISDIDRHKQHAYITTSKNKRVRIVMWTKQTHELLIRYLGVRLCLNERSELFQSPPGSPRITRLTHCSIQRWCREIGRELGFPINPHAFRHGKMHQVLNLGGNRHHVQTIAGHKSIVASEVYTRMNIQEQLRLQGRYLQEQ